MACETTMARAADKYTVQVCISPDESSGQVTVMEDCHSNVSECVASQPCDSGHEKLLSAQAKTGNKIGHCRPSRPPSYFHLSLLLSFPQFLVPCHVSVTVLCNCPLGGLALLFSLLSQRNYKQGRYEDAKAKGNVAKWFSIVGIAITGVIVAFVIVYFVYIDKNIVDTEEDLNQT